MTGDATLQDDILRFWFDETEERFWFARNDDFDRTIRDRFGSTVAAAAEGRLDHWAATPRGALALVLLLDQFPRNLFRGSSRAFATDAAALATARAAIDRGLDLDPALERRQRVFFYLPFMHSESLADQEACVRLMRERGGSEVNIDFAERHRAIIERFGRFPHRNAVLGRQSTPEELAFLQQPGSSF